MLNSGPVLRISPVWQTVMGTLIPAGSIADGLEFPMIGSVTSSWHPIVRLAVFSVALSMCRASADEPRASATEPRDRVLLSESFDDSHLLQRGWYDGSKFKIVSPGVLRRGRCIEYRWQTGALTPMTSSGIRHAIRPTSEVFVRFYLRLSKNWEWSRKPYHPHLMRFLTTENSKYHGPARSRLTLYIEPVGGKLRLAATDMQNADAPHGLTQGPLRGGYNGKHYDSSRRVFENDRWYCVEAQFKLNSLDLVHDRPNHDGLVRGWVDGQLVVERTDVVFRSTDYPHMKWNQFLLTPYFGRGLLPHAQALWIDELVISTERVGCIR